VPGGVILSQRLTGPEGLPTTVARTAAAALVCAAAALGYAAGPDGAGDHARQSHPIAISRLAGELPIATPEPRPELRAAAALPALRERPARRTRRVARTAAPAPPPTPAATAEPAPTPRPPIATAAPPAPAPTAPRPKPAPRSTPEPIFESTG